MVALVTVIHAFRDALAAATEHTPLLDPISLVCPLLELLLDVVLQPTNIDKPVPVIKAMAQLEETTPQMLDAEEEVVLPLDDAVLEARVQAETIKVRFDEIADVPSAPLHATRLAMPELDARFEPEIARPLLQTLLEVT